MTVKQKKHLWFLDMTSQSGTPLYTNTLVRVPARPTIKLPIQGKPEWDDFTFVIPEGLDNLAFFNYLRGVYEHSSDFSDKAERVTLYLRMADKMSGDMLEEWELVDAWTTSVEFGSVEDDAIDIGVKVRFQRCRYRSLTDLEKS